MSHFRMDDADRDQCDREHGEQPNNDRGEVSDPRAREDLAESGKEAAPARCNRCGALRRLNLDLIARRSRPSSDDSPAAPAST
jgi:hypothetical protein